MTERKFVRLLITVLVAILGIFAGNGAWAAGQCLKPENTGIPAGECVNVYGYDVWVNRGTSGLFPDYVDGDSVYVWSISSSNTPDNPTKYAVGHIDVEIPANIADYSTISNGDNTVVQIIGNDCTCNLTYSPSGSYAKTWFLYDKGKGDSSTGFGKYEFDKYVLKIIPGTVPCAIANNNTITQNIKVTFKGKLLFSGPDEFLIKTSTKGGSAEALSLLGPSLSSQATPFTNVQPPPPPVLSGQTYVLGDTGCMMSVTLNSDSSIANALLLPVDPGNAPDWCDGPLPIKDAGISDTWLCDKGTNGPENCKRRHFAEKNFMEEDAGSCTYRYTTTTGSTTYVTLQCGTTGCRCGSSGCPSGSPTPTGTCP